MSWSESQRDRQGGGGGLIVTQAACLVDVAGELLDGGGLADRTGIGFGTEM